ncbi:TPA: hypothetical protein ACH3X1_007529 [Trebouxia sp. C0004]
MKALISNERCMLVLALEKHEKLKKGVGNKATPEQQQDRPKRKRARVVTADDSSGSAAAEKASPAQDSLMDVETPTSATEPPGGVKAGTRGGGRGPLHNRSNRELWRKVWQDLPDVDTLFDADEMESILESFYEADLSNELAPGAADFDVSCDEVEATHVFNLKDDFFDVSHQSIVLPTAIDMSLRPTSEPVCHYDAAAEVDRVLSGM